MKSNIIIVTKVKKLVDKALPRRHNKLYYVVRDFKSNPPSPYTIYLCDQKVLVNEKNNVILLSYNIIIVMGNSLIKVHCL